jgi:mono/diheme cytochrome c family protein
MLMLRHLRYGLVALAALTALSIPAAAVELGNKEAGHAYAEKHCSGCHAIDKDATLLFSDVPSFQEIADTQGMSPQALVVWFQTSHPNMPDLIIPPDDMDNVIAYIMSLRTPKQ